jgi:cytochrome P450
LVQHDPTQWQKPSEFIPERFDIESEFFKRPDGGKRHPMAFSAFIGGARICLGKSFAEIMVRFTLSFMLYHYKFEFADPKYKENKPLYNGNATKMLPVVMKKIPRNPLPAN